MNRKCILAVLAGSARFCLMLTALLALALVADSCKPLRTPNDDEPGTKDPVDGGDGDTGGNTGGNSGGNSGGGTTETWLDLSWDMLNEKRESLQRKDLQLVDVEPYTSGNSVLYAGIWLEGDDKDRLWKTDSWTEFQKKWDDFAGDQYRLIDLEVYPKGNGREILGIWRKRAEKHLFRANFNWKTFLTLKAELGEKGYRIFDIEAYGVGGEVRYAAIWEQASDEEKVWKAASKDQFVDKWREYEAQKLRLVDMEVFYGEGNVKYYVGVWREGDDNQKLWLEDTWDGFNTQRQKFERENFRFLDIEIETRGNTRTYSGIWRFGKVESAKPEPTENSDFIVYGTPSASGKSNTKKVVRSAPGPAATTSKKKDFTTRDDFVVFQGKAGVTE